MKLQASTTLNETDRWLVIGALLGMKEKWEELARCEDYDQLKREFNSQAARAQLLATAIEQANEIVLQDIDD